MERPDFIVCGTTCMSDAIEEQCSRCQSVVWPTAGSMIVAVQQKIPLLCLDCFSKSKEYKYAGFVHHGILVPDSLGNEMLMALEKALFKKRSTSENCSPHDGV